MKLVIKRAFPEGTTIHRANSKSGSEGSRATTIPFRGSFLNKISLFDCLRLGPIKVYEGRVARAHRPAAFESSLRIESSLIYVNVLPLGEILGQGNPNRAAAKARSLPAK